MTTTEFRQSQFKRQARVLAPRQAARMRKQFIQTFLDASTDFFKQNIRHPRRFSDGICYQGYLWDCLAHYSRISFKILLRRLLRYDKVFVFWDIHSSERILIKDPWLFPKPAVLELPSEILAANLVFLPEDVYIFDSSFRWALILTHEYDKEGNDIFLIARPIKPR
jgi:hypothetical protein